MVSRIREIARMRPLYEQLGMTKVAFEDETRSIRQWNAFKGEPLESGAFDHMSAAQFRKLRSEAERGTKREADRFNAWFEAERTAALASLATA